MKYLIRNDFKELRKRPLRILIVILAMEILFQGFLFGNDTYNTILGRNLADMSDYLGILFFILNSLFYVYITLHIFTRDLIYNLDNIFLRMQSWKFVVEKIIFIVLSILILRVIQYIVVLPLILGFNKSIGTIIVMIIKDTLYYSCISIIAVALKEFSYKIKNMYIFLITLVLIILPKNFDTSYIYYILGIIIFSIISILIMINKSKDIIENEGEKYEN